MNKYIKIGIAAVLLVLSIYMFYEREYGWGVMFALLTVLPIFLFFRNEYILLAFWQMRNQKLDEAKKWLTKITNPQAQLIGNQMGYYHFMMGLTEGQNNVTTSEKYMKKALEYGLNFGHDRAMAKLNIAAAAMAKGRKNEAKKWLAEARADDNQNMLTEHISMMEEQLKRVNVGRNMQNPNMRRRGKYF